jgi:hypothetical protein
MQTGFAFAADYHVVATTNSDDGVFPIVYKDNGMQFTIALIGFTGSPAAPVKSNLNAINAEVSIVVFGLPVTVNYPGA